MSLITVTSPLSALNPKVWVEEGRLHARTNLFLMILCLFFWQRTVIVDRRERTVLVRSRFLWLLENTRVIPFSEIDHLYYRYNRVSTGWDMMGRDTDSLESFSVGLSLEDGSEVNLLAFRGDGTGMTGVSGVLMGDSLVDTEGDQEGASLGFVDQLQRFTGKSLGKRRRFGYEKNDFR
ncbi:MAG: hypothetical protein U0414_22965 [Polyangiaceae bacterium]